MGPGELVDSSQWVNRVNSSDARGLGEVRGRLGRVQSRLKPASAGTLRVGCAPGWERPGWLAAPLDSQRYNRGVEAYGGRVAADPGHATHGAQGMKPQRISHPEASPGALYAIFCFSGILSLNPLACLHALRRNRLAISKLRNWGV
jgi:hypothetical protein